MSWNGEYLCIKTEAPKPTLEHIQLLSDEDALYMAECFGVEVSDAVKQDLIAFFDL